MFKILRIFTIGCGLIGNKRAENINNKYAKIVACNDIDKKNSEKFSKKFNCEIAENYKSLDLNKFDIAFISTTHDKLFEIAKFFISKKKHVFIEKPGALNIKQVAHLYKLHLKNKNINAGIGLNHRFHLAFIKAFDLIKKKKIGDLMFIRGQYGHGGRIGYNKEWRAKSKIAGGGEMIDQGSHLIDLSIKLLGELTVVNGEIRNYYWNMEVEDNCFLNLENKKKNIAFLQASCTEWKNTFNFEIYGKKGKIQIFGLGRSYGVETLKLFIMKKKMGPPKTIEYKYNKKDLSWKLEQDNFFKSILDKKILKKYAALKDMYEIHKIMNQIYLNK